MRRLATVTLVAFGVMLLPARPAEAQGFWRWLEELSGPRMDGPGFELLFICHQTGGGRSGGDDWFISPQCAGADRTRQWISLGLQLYTLTGDNNLTADPNDRVDATGLLPVIDFNFSRALAVGGGLGVRRYSAPTGQFNHPDAEAWVKWRPLATVFSREAALRAPEPSPRHEWLEVRLGLVFHKGFEAGRFGPGTPALDADVSPVVFFGVNLLNRN